MKIGIIVYAFMLADSLNTLLGRILAETDAHLYLFLHSQQRDVVIVCESNLSVFQWWPRINYFPYGENRGLARSANDGLIQGYADGCDVMLTCNDDVMPAPGDIEKIAQAAIDNRDRYKVEGMGYDERKKQYGPIEWALAAINPIALETIGYFDENFAPAYYDDTDYSLRARRAGLKSLVAPDTNLRHAGSGSLEQVDRNVHDDQFMRNQGYYFRKWGGEKGYELYEQPFNNPAFGLKIAESDRRAPYPGYNRVEREATT